MPPNTDPHDQHTNLAAADYAHPKSPVYPSECGPVCIDKVNSDLRTINPP